MKDAMTWNPYHLTCVQLEEFEHLNLLLIYQSVCWMVINSVDTDNM